MVFSSKAALVHTCRTDPNNKECIIDTSSTVQLFTARLHTALLPLGSKSPSSGDRFNVTVGQRESGLPRCQVSWTFTLKWPQQSSLTSAYSAALTQQDHIVGVWLVESSPFRWYFIRKSKPCDKKKKNTWWMDRIISRSLLTTASLQIA